MEKIKRLKKKDWIKALENRNKLLSDLNRTLLARVEAMARSLDHYERENYMLRRKLKAPLNRSQNDL